MDSENKKLSRNRKKIDRRIKIDDKMKPLLNKIKPEQINKIKKNDKIKDLEIELLKIKYADNPIKLQRQLKKLKKIHVHYKKFTRE